MIHFTFQLIPLAIGFGVGYLLLVKAAKHEGILEIVGKFLGWLLIVASLLVGLVSGYYSIKIIKTGHLPGCHHRHEMIRQQQEQQEQKEQSEQDEQNETQEEIREQQNSH